MESWTGCRNILCIHTDNMGDLLMSIPAVRALRESFGCKITMLTSPAGAEAVGFIREIDDLLVFNSPWNRMDTPAEDTERLIGLLRSRAFDGAVIFTVYSQNPLPAAMLAFMAGIPRRLAYCRENPYQLLTHWIPDEEPYFNIIHQVRRDMKLVAAVGAVAADDRLRLHFSEKAWAGVQQKVSRAGADPGRPWIILHPGVSEKKREYPPDQWIATGKQILQAFDLQLLFTGANKERELAMQITAGIGAKAFCLAGLLELEEFIALISHAPLVISVNTATVHIAAATGTALIVLYALTNPQHTPWGVPFRLLPFHPPRELQSKNQVVQYVYRALMSDIPDEAGPQHVVKAIEETGLIETREKASVADQG